MPEPMTFRERLLIALSRWRIQLGFCFAIPALYFAHPTAGSFLVFLPIVLGGVLLRVWARGHLDRATRVCTGGPYAYLRHPLYAGSFLMGLGVTSMALPWFVVPLYVAVFVAMYLPKALREEAYLTERFGGDYHAYSTATSAVLPTFGHHAGAVAPSRFEIARVWRHREWHTWIGTTVVLTYVWLMTFRP